MVPAPGDDSALMVMSNSGQQPHYVRQSKAGGYLCDDRCLGYKSSKICSHTVAAALKNGTISGFTRWYQTLKCKPNFTKLSESGKPTTAGQKPKRKGAPKKVTKKVQNILASASEDSFHNLAHLTGSSVCATMSSSASGLIVSCHHCCSKSGWSFSPEFWVSKSCCCEPVLTWPSSSCACICLPS